MSKWCGAVQTGDEKKQVDDSYNLRSRKGNKHARKDIKKSIMSEYKFERKDSSSSDDFSLVSKDDLRVMENIPKMDEE